MIYWDLFLVFFKIGAVSFGGGYEMCIRDRNFPALKIILLS